MTQSFSGRGGNQGDRALARIVALEKGSPAGFPVRRLEGNSDVR